MKETSALLLIVFGFLGMTLTSHGTVNAKLKGNHSIEPGNFSNAFPCPLEQDIFPCICTYNSDSQELLLDCSAVKNETELEAVFEATFPNTAFTELRIENNDNLTVLGDVFGDVTFKRVYLMDVSQLSFITEASFFGSRYTLQRLDIWYTKLSTFTVPILTLGLYPNLNRFSFAGDYRNDSFPVLESNSLTYMDFFHWNIPSLPVDAFRGTPNVSTIGAHDLALSGVIPGTLDGLQHLTFVSMCCNKIARLLPGTLTVTSLTTRVDFSSNVIATVDVGAFAFQNGVYPLTANVLLNDNLLTTLESDVWLVLLQVIRALDLRDNPLTCGCDLAWLVLAPDLMAKVHPYSTCYDSTFLHDLDPVIFGDLCPV